MKRRQSIFKFLIKLEDLFFHILFDRSRLNGFFYLKVRSQNIQYGQISHGAAEMEALETAILASLQYPCPYRVGSLQEYMTL